MTDKQSYERFTMFDNWGEIFEEMSDEDAVQLFRAMYRYAFYNIEPEFSKGSALSLTWKAIKPNIDSSGKAARNGSNKPTAKPPKETPSETTKETPSEQKKRREEEKKGNGKEKKAEGNSLEKNSPSASASDGAAAGEPAPTSAPRCPLCDSELERTGMPEPEAYWCNSCKDFFAEGKVKR